MSIQRITFFGQYSGEERHEVSVTTEAETFGEVVEAFAGFAAAMQYTPDTIAEHLDTEVFSLVEPPDCVACDIKATPRAKPLVDLDREELQYIRDVIAVVGDRSDVLQSIRRKFNDAKFEVDLDRFNGTVNPA